MQLTTCSKRFDNLPFAHRQPNHTGHCSLIHGHNWSFEFEFVGPPDKCGFVVDFGGLKWLRDWLNEKFDHTIVLNEDDPWLQYLRGSLTDVTHMGNGPVELAKIVAVPNCGAEGLANYLFDEVNRMLMEWTEGRCGVLCVTVREDEKNTATCRKLVTHSKL